MKNDAKVRLREWLTVTKSWTNFSDAVVILCDLLLECSKGSSADKSEVNSGWIATFRTGSHIEGHAVLGATMLRAAWSCLLLHILLLGSVHRLIFNDLGRFGNRLCFRLQVWKASNPGDPLDIVSTNEHHKSVNLLRYATETGARPWVDIFSINEQHNSVNLLRYATKTRACPWVNKFSTNIHHNSINLLRYATKTRSCPWVVTGKWLLKNKH